MGSLIYKCDESYGNQHWETKAFVSDYKTEVSITQTWFEGTTVVSKQNVMMTSQELKNIVERIEKHNA
jgi:hypothetical protein